MLGPLCFYNNQIFVVDTNGYLIAYKYMKYKKNDDDQNFKEKFRLQIPLPESFHVKSIVLDTVNNFSTSLKCITIVAISLYYDISIHLFHCNIKNTFITINSSNWLPPPSVEPNSNFFITHGPTLLFSSTQENFLCILPYKVTSKFNIPISDHYSSSKIFQFSFIGRLNIKDPVDVLLLIQSYEYSADCRKICVCSFGFKIKERDFPVICHEIPIFHFFPMHFQNSADMIHVWNISVDESQVCYLKDIKWDCNYSFLCTKTNSFLFCNGILKYIFEKPGLNISYIITEFYEMPFSSVKLILVTKTRDIFFISSNDSSTSLQLNKTWKNIEAVLYGDIMINGSKHLLLLKDTSSDTWQKDCILSDISDFIPIDYITKSKEIECSLNKAMPGIQSKILTSKSAIANSRTNIEKKMEATLDSLHRLNVSMLVNAQIDHHISSFRESMVDIILSKDEVKQSIKSDENKVKLSIQKHSKKLCYNHWVLSWAFCNKDDRTICNPVLNIWIPNEHTQCFQRIIVHKSHTFSIDDEFQKQISPNENFSIIISFEIPEFSSEILAIHGVLSWYIGTSDEFENELYLPLKEKVLTQQQMCLKTSISLEDIFTSKLEDISNYEDLICIKILQQRIVFKILSLVTDLRNFEDLIISSSYAANNLLLLTSSNTKILVFDKINQPLYGVHIVFRTVNQSSVEVDVYARNEKEIALVEKYLYQRLPSDILILANGVSTEESIHLKQQAVCCMKDELDLILSMLNIHNVQEPVEKFDVQPSTVVISKKNFIRIRKVLLKKECRTDNIMQLLNRIKFFRTTE